LASGVLRLDVRLTIKTDDGALIYVSYNGIEKDSDVTELQAIGKMTEYKDGPGGFVKYEIYTPR
jgi:hypothetical protein